MTHAQIKFHEFPGYAIDGFLPRKYDEKRANFLTGKLYYAEKLHPYPAPQESHVHTHVSSISLYMFTRTTQSCKPFFNGN